MYSVQCTVPVFVLSVSTGPSVTCGTKLSWITASRQLLLGENTLHTEGWEEGIVRQKKEEKNVIHKFRTISIKSLVKEITVQIVMTKKKLIILKVILKVLTNIKAMKVTVVTVVTRMVVTVIVAKNK